MGDQAEQLFGRIVDAYVQKPEVELGTGFGSIPGLRVGGKIFAMLARGSLVVKLPRERVATIVGSGGGTRFDPGHGRLMKEWVAVPARSGADWRALVDEAFAFVAEGSADGRTRRS